MKIAELARQMVELSGYVPDRDVSIQFSGLRPGEKLYEELLIDPEQAEGIANPRIFCSYEPLPETRTIFGSRSIEKSDCRKLFGSCLECDVQTGPRV